MISLSDDKIAEITDRMKQILDISTQRSEQFMNTYERQHKQNSCKNNVNDFDYNHSNSNRNNNVLIIDKSEPSLVCYIIR